MTAFKCESKDFCSTFQDTLSRKCKKESKANKPIYFCSFEGCKKSYYTNTHLRRHEEIHTTGIYKCTEGNCGKVFKTRYTLKKHIDNLHLKKYPKKYKCSYCDENFNNHNWLVKHVFKKHTGIKPFLCPKEDCEKRFLFPTRLKRHMKVHKDFTCPEADCGKVFPKGVLLSHHIKCDHPTIHKCLECGNIFSTPSNLNAHLQVHKPVRELFKCPKPGCNRTYVKKSNLNHHFRSCHEKQVCKQKKCHKTFKSKTSLISPCSLLHEKRNVATSEVPKLPSVSSSKITMDSNCQQKFTKENVRWQENTESFVPDECDEVMILPTPPKPQPPVITLDDEGNSAPCLNTRVGPDVCSRDLNVDKATQIVTPLLMSNTVPCFVVPGELPVLFQNVIQYNPNGIVFQMTLSTK